jgi:hypothetical protein
VRQSCLISYTGTHRATSDKHITTGRRVPNAESKVGSESDQTSMYLHLSRNFENPIFVPKVWRKKQKTRALILGFFWKFIVFDSAFSSLLPEARQ